MANNAKDEPERQGNTQPKETEDANGINRSVWREFRKPLFWTLMGLSITIVIVFIILPDLFVLLGAMWPACFNSSSALQQLAGNVDSFVGIVSLCVGLVSIIYAFHSSHTMEAQTQKQRQIQNEIKKTLDEQKKTLDDISDKSKQIYNALDKKDDLGYGALNSSDVAHEENNI